MHKEEDGSIRAVLLQGTQTCLVVVQVLLHVASLDLKDVNHDADVLKDGRLLDGQVGIHESVLTATIPEVQDEVAKEADMILFDIDSRTKT